MKHRLQQLRTGETPRPKPEHPKEPWNCLVDDEVAGELNYVVYDMHKAIIAEGMTAPTSERIVMCVNMLADFSTEDIEDRGDTNPLSVITEYQDAIRLVKELLQDDDLGDRTLSQCIELIYERARDRFGSI